MNGLSEIEAARRLASEGYNELPSARPRSAMAIAWSVAREPMFLLLLAIAVIYIFLGDPHEAAILLLAVIGVMGLTFVQERRTERTLESLRLLSSPRALVIRDGQQTRIAGRDVVRGDLIVLTEGDRVPADGILFSGEPLSIDESLLTGESSPVRKEPGSPEVEMGRPGGDGTCFVFSGSLVVQGRGIAVARTTGPRTEMGRIGRSIRSIAPSATLLERATRRLVRAFSLAGVIVCGGVVLLYGLTRGSWLTGVLAGLTAAISMVPEEFVVVLTVFLALGAWRIAQKRVLTRRMPAIETLGAATALCVDKTGTLTENRMAVRKLAAAGREYDTLESTVPPPQEFRELVRVGALASRPEPFDPMEKAIHALAEAWREDDFGELRLVRHYPLCANLLAMSQAWRRTNSDVHLLAAKGAPEAIAALCRMDQAAHEEMARQVDALATRGMRVLGVARRNHSGEELPESQTDYPYEFLGLIGLADPVRPGVSQSVAECHRAGIRLLMITGDYPATASSVAREIGLANPDHALTGAELERMSREELRRQVGSVNVFARVMPEQKLLLVEALKANGEVVAMTGDGVNDAPALRAAQIGIAMGGRGTDVAREAADLVLLDDDFTSIVHAVRLGRRIYANLKQAMSYIIAVHVPIAGICLLPILFGWPLVLLAVHIVFIEMIVDPACAIVFEAEPEDADIMSRPPRDRREPILSRRAIVLSLLQGGMVLMTLLVIFGVAMARGQGEPDARALTFATLVVANLGMILVYLSDTQTLLAAARRPNPVLRAMLIGVPITLSLVLYVPILRELFRFSALHVGDILLCLLAGLACSTWLEVCKRYRHWRAAAGGRAAKA